MNRRQAIAATATICAAALMISQGVSARGAQSAAAGMTKVSITVDGGYAFVVGKNGELSIVTPNHSAGGVMNHDHPQLQLVTGSSTAVSVAKPLEISGFKFGLGTSGTVSHSTATTVTQPGDCSPEPTADNLTWMPDMLALHPGATPKLGDANVDMRTTLAGGVLTVLGGRGCWSFSSSAAGRSVSAGENVARYDVTIPSKTLSFVMTPLSGTSGTPTTVNVAPIGGAIKLKLGWKSAHVPKVNRKVGDPLSDFDRFYGLLTMPAGASQAAPKRASLTSADLKFNQTAKKGIPKGECPSVLIYLK